MYERDWRFKIDDMLDCIAAIEGFTEGFSRATFKSDRLVFDAVVRNIEILGEAAKAIPNDVLARYSEIQWKA